MEEYKVHGIVLNSSDYMERDKIITLFTLELGKISAKLKGVKSSKAKLKFAGQPFCFGEWVLNKTADKYTVVSCSLIDSFYDLTINYDLFLNASKILKTINYTFKPNMINETMFLAVINLLKFLVYGDCNKDLILLKMYFEILKESGYMASYTNCVKCGKPLVSNIYLDLNSSGFCCENCSNIESDLLLTRQEFAYMKIISSTSVNKIETIKIPESVVFNILNIVEKQLKLLFDLDFVGS